MTRLNMENMEQYLRTYDVLSQKYFWDMENVPETLIRKAVLLEKNHKGSTGVWNFEKAQDAYLMVNKIYDDETKNHLGILQIVSEKFIGGFVGIEGVDQLFAPSYFYFEWMMHLEYSLDRHDYINYRDHYIHQIKNLYEMLVLLDDYGYMNYCMESYQSNSNLIANYIKSGIEKQIRIADKQEKNFFKKIAMQTAGNQFSGEDRKRMQEYCYRYLIHSVAIVAALTHDIGYPIAYMLRTADNLHGFLPLAEAFLHRNDAMPHLEEILQDSLLYRTVDTQEIAQRINDKQDHGAISAVILLSKYYETGAIYHLEPIERVVIELSAVVVYHHTLKYKYMTGGEGLRYRNLFEENPISYLFRLCDDLQEWGRVYFDVSKRSNFLICPRCHMPINRDNSEDNIEGHTRKSSHVNISYSCGCGKSGIRRTQFPYRKLTNISACDALVITESPGQAGAKKRMTLRMEYNLISLLQLSLYNPRFAKQRADGVYEVKRMVDGQGTIPEIYINTFITNNPIAIKVQCLERYLRHIHLKEEGEDYICRGQDYVWQRSNLEGSIQDTKLKRERLQKLRKKFVRRIRNKFIKQDKEWYFSGAKKIVQQVCQDEEWNDENDNGLPMKVKKKWVQNLGFYHLLSALGANMEEFRRSGCLQERGEVLSLSKEIADLVVGRYQIVDRPTASLITDYLWQRIRNVSEAEFYDHRNREEDEQYGVHELYEEAALSNQAMINAVEEYVESEAYNIVKAELQKERPKGLEGIYDFYTDYELFSAMAQKAASMEVWQK